MASIPPPRNDDTETTSSTSTSTSTTTTWLTLARTKANEWRLPNAQQIYQVLCAFGGPQYAPGPVSLELLLLSSSSSSSSAAVVDSLARSMETQLTTEIDADQARLFARRFVSVAKLLSNDDNDNDDDKNQNIDDDNDDDDDYPKESSFRQRMAARIHSLLGTGLIRRAHQILYMDAPPRALRIRALVDFYWSQASVVLLQQQQLQQQQPQPRLPTVQELVHQTLDQTWSSSSSSSLSSSSPLLFAPGCWHTTIQGATSLGPVHMNVLKIQADAAVQMRTMDARLQDYNYNYYDGGDSSSSSSTTNNTTTPAFGNLDTLAQTQNALAATSGGFFLYSEPDIDPPSVRTDPVGLIVTDTIVQRPPVWARAALLQTTDGRFHMTTVGMSGVTIAITGRCCCCCCCCCHTRLANTTNRGTTTEVDADDQDNIDNNNNNNNNNDNDNREILFHGTVDNTMDSNGIRCVHRGHGKTVTISNEEMGISIVGRKVVDVLLQSTNHSRDDDDDNNKSTRTSSERTMDVPLAGFVLIIPSSSLPLSPPPSSSSSSSSSPVRVIQSGDDVSYTLPIPNVQAAMAGGPILYCADGTLPALDLASEDFCGSAPPVTFSQDETFDNNLLPRMAAGLTVDGDLVMVAIDGRNLDRALGLTLRGTADLLKSMGCVRAMNLDGGSSKRMYIRGKGVVCLSTTEIKASVSKKSESTTTASTAAAPTDASDTGGCVEKQRPVHSAILFLPSS